MKQTPLRQNRLGLRGWFWAGNYKLERYLYLFHRLTGLSILLFLLLHLYLTTSSRFQGQDVWVATLTLFAQPGFKIVAYLVVAAFVYHALNGLRLAFQELGFALGRPTPPIYPYRDALRQKRPWTITMAVAMISLAALFLFDFLTGGW